MHSFDRTLLAKLGFSDTDKKNPLHDLACHYLTLPEVVRKVWDHADMGAGCRFDGVDGVCCEVPISKGRDQYRTTIGFVDCLVCVRCTNGKVTNKSRFAFEVKCGKPQIGDVIRQINLYCEYDQSVAMGLPATRWHLVTFEDLSSVDVEMLLGADIYHLKLGAAFTAWAEAQQQEKNTAFEI